MKIVKMPKDILLHVDQKMIAKEYLYLFFI